MAKEEIVPLAVGVVLGLGCSLAEGVVEAEAQLVELRVSHAL